MSNPPHNTVPQLPTVHRVHAPPPPTPSQPICSCPYSLPPSPSSETLLPTSDSSSGNNLLPTPSAATCYLLLLLQRLTTGLPAVTPAAPRPDRPGALPCQCLAAAHARTHHAAPLTWLQRLSLHHTGPSWTATRSNTTTCSTGGRRRGAQACQ